MTARFTVPADHPCLPGHFPGRPVVPGVLLLDAVLRAAAGLGDAPVRIRRAKFAAPVAPGAEVEIRFESRAGGRTGFTCRCGGTTVLLGEL
ncbi:3-hydroxyacyl-ACP dehydratase FabZ family protein [Roseococcus sp. SYP-B2431]|uniref:3-hydroxyacyl-ACP dehydratase FabZ family protein n=1 Tax=Roseococcus sp. SYP-B2431 TaxID=2496640 RepID=UPI0013F3BDAC|nr:beta-hydroxyacyl-ACP dehydratase [Roseococcus sp. SYP-B2431]